MIYQNKTIKKMENILRMKHEILLQKQKHNIYLYMLLFINVYDNKTNEIEVICLAALKEKNIQPQITYKKNDKTGFNDAF